MYEDIKQKVCEIAVALNQHGLVQLSGGNVSARGSAEHIAITPSGLPYERMKPEDIVIVDLQGGPVEGNLKPSSESPMHTFIFRERSDVNAIIHSHSTYAIAFAVAGKSIPIVCTEGLAVNGPVPVADYACPGTEEQGHVALKALQGPPAVTGVLLRNHGVLTIAPNLDRAYNIAYRIELSAKIYFLASQIGTPTILTDEQVAEIRRVYLKK